MMSTYVIRSKCCRMAGCKVFLICLILFCCVASGNFTREANWCYPQIPCDDRQCVDRKSWCDYSDDCKDDGSDEKYCDTKSFWGSPDHKCDERLHFVCSNERCVPKVLRCDGIDDCGDRSDEENCMNSEDDRSESEPPAQDIVTTTTELYDRVSGSLAPAPSSMGMNRPFQAPAVDYYGNRREEDPNGRRRENRDRSRDTTYHRENANHGHHTSRSDTAPTYPYNQGVHPHTQVRNQRWDYQTSVSGKSRTHGETTRDSFSGRQLWPVIHQPRAVIHSQPQSDSSRRNRRRHRSRPLPPFHFAENRAQDYSRRYRNEIRGAEGWLMNRRDDSQGWEEDTPRALVALSLVTNSFPSSSTEHGIMRKRLKLNLGARLLRIKEQPLSDNRLAFYINALLATCQDPRQIYDQDLVAMLYYSTHDARRRSTPSPFVLLTLCLSNSSFSLEDLNSLKYIIRLPITGEATKDRFILATSALACVHKRGIFQNELDETLSTATRKLIDQQLADGSFGSVYSTALAAQAFFALDSNQWDENEALDFLLRFKMDDGSFGDMLATYYILPVISGRSLVHLRNTQCERLDEDISESSEENDWTPDQPQKNILYSLAVGQQQRNSIALHMTVPAEANFFRIMQMAQEVDPRFKFQYARSFGGIEVHTISGIPNDPERGTYWNLYILDRRNQTINKNKVEYGDISHLIPGDSQELLFWYLP